MKRFLFWVVLIGLNLMVVEIALNVYYFQSRSDHPLAMVHYIGPAQQKLYALFNSMRGERNIGIWKYDERFGYVHISNSSGTERSPDFVATYTIGSEQQRVAPTPAISHGRLLFLGGSYTFGHGVQDDETFTYILGRDYWSGWTVVNKAVTGWGTAQAYMRLADEVASDTPPAMVIYGMIPHHLERNYIRKSWVSRIAESGWRHPHFEVVEGIPIYNGLVGVDQSIADGPDITAREYELTVAFLAAMKRACEDRDIPFAVVLLEGTWPSPIIESLIDNNIPFLDLWQTEFYGLSSADPHPNPDDHRAIARIISESFIGKTLRILSVSRP